ncbi:MAG: hypothetical protein JNJ41_02480 [Bacteroidia bacterium]|nr:hypothetical protein [Bacteroidia bacterium]
MLSKLDKALALYKAKQNKEIEKIAEHIDKTAKFKQEYKITEIAVIHPKYNLAKNSFEEMDFDVLVHYSNEEISKAIGNFPDGNLLSVEMYGDTFHVLVHPDYNEQKITVETRYGSMTTKDHYSNKEITTDLLDEIITDNFDNIVSSYG